MRSELAWPIVAAILAVFVGFVSLIWPLRPEMTPGGPTVDIEERDVLTELPAVYRPELARFPVRFGDQVSPYRLMALFVMPEETIDLEVVTPNASAVYDVEATGGTAESNGPSSWKWRAPSEPGMYPIHVDERPSRFSVTFNAFVLTPYSVASTSLNGYEIGQYETKPLRGDSVYLPPEGFIEITPGVEDMLVSPHFTVGQFLCKQESRYPKYLLLREPLLLKLEVLLRELNERGIEARSLHVMSGFRTPFYNRLIGNTTSYSRHLFGGAADVFVDADDDNYMDDLNGDGEADREDAVFMARIIEEMAEEPWYDPLVGGLGIYGPAPHRGPFIHIDVRGQRVRW